MRLSSLPPRVPLRAVLPLLAALTLAACSRPEPAPEPIRSVKVMTVAAGPLQAGHEYAGEVRPRIESRLGFRVGGKIIRRQAEVGQRVAPGQVLAQLDPQDLKLSADAARAQVAAAQTNRDLAAADFKRYQTLREQNFISGAELERRETTLKAAQAQLEQAQAQLSAQSNQARYGDLVADVAGVVTAIEAEPGQVVAAGATVVRIAQDGPRDVVFTIPEDKLASVRAGLPVQARAWAAPTVLNGKVREVAASADPVTRTYTVKVALDGDAPLGATMTVVPQGVVPGAVPQVLKLPTSALRQEGQGTAIWVVDPASMTVRSQAVQVATADGNEAVIAGGLQPGQTVVTAGVHVLQPGQKVRIWQDRGAAPAAAPAASAASMAAVPASR